MVDIVERLRQPWLPSHLDHTLMRRAAAEITCLREEVKRKDAALEWYASPEAWTMAEIEGPNGDYGKRARAALTPAQEKTND
jgi:hypothetical protein